MLDCNNKHGEQNSANVVNVTHQNQAGDGCSKGNPIMVVNNHEQQTSKEAQPTYKQTLMGTVEKQDK